MSSLPFSIDVEDIKFVLFDQLGMHDDLAKAERYEEFDREVYESMVDEAARLVTEVVHPVNSPGDRQGCTLEDGNVTTPDGYLAAWKAVAEGGWINPSAPVDAGGVGAPAVMYMVVTEMMIQGSMAFAMYPGLTAGAANLLYHHAPEPWRAGLAEKLFTGEWGGTMCLTEAGAGSDVGANRCKAVPVEGGEPGLYLLEGEKIFISGGDQDLTDNIVHLVLARTPGSPPGTKGLSIFMVPKFEFDFDTWELGARNDARVVGIEEKMGIHGNATCTLALGSQGECRGWLLGEEHQGIKIMFMMMNEARIGVGCQGVGVSAASYTFALAYAKDRVQGTSLANMRDPDAAAVSITHHPDVRRMLMTMKVQTEAMRSMLYRLGHRNDLAETFEEEHGSGKDFVDLLVPVLKSHCTDTGFEMAAMGVQVLGGYGYIGEYPLEQLCRDAKIASIYEGTNGIQALDLLGRKLRMKGGALFMGWMQDCMAVCAKGREAGFEAQAAAIEKSINQTGAAAMHLGTIGAKGRFEAAAIQANPFLSQMGTVHLAVECMEQALAAKRCMAERGETVHLKGKLLNLDFYVSNILPKATAFGKIVQSDDESCMDGILFG
ncbi:MAG: alkylation response protein AidB-like acyl-CoA dehydrogenase [Myxococcota bacterium]|jgi:alkylation response protein AidB-like acyl-CoA dehydrogenase